MDYGTEIIGELSVQKMTDYINKCLSIIIDKENLFNKTKEYDGKDDDDSKNSVSSSSSEDSNTNDEGKVEVIEKKVIEIEEIDFKKEILLQSRIIR